jgi:uncharacterized membrane protein
LVLATTFLGEKISLKVGVGVALMIVGGLLTLAG